MDLVAELSHVWLSVFGSLGGVSCGCGDGEKDVDGRSWPGRAWGRLLWATVGYGHRPWCTLLWLLALVTIGTLVIMSRPDAEFTADPGAPARNTLLYTVDVLSPIVVAMASGLRAAPS